MRSLFVTALITALLGMHACVRENPAPNPGRPTLFVVGDSTASNGDRLGWAILLAGYFDASKVNVQNRARAGRSARTFLK